MWYAKKNFWVKLCHYNIWNNNHLKKINLCITASKITRPICESIDNNDDCKDDDNDWATDVIYTDYNNKVKL